MSRVNTACLRDCLIAGMHRVIEQRDHINQINVFPVADADTGTNLAFTLRSVLANMPSAELPLDEFCERVADLALDGARGNSGAILAQFFQGFAEAVEHLPEVGMAQLAQAVSAGAECSRLAIVEPREGTMLSVIAAWGEALSHEAESGDMVASLGRALEAAQQALAATPEQLEVLRQNNVVDAGAQGFVDLLEGAQVCLATDAPPETAPELMEFVDEALPEATEMQEAEHRYCCECLVTGENVDRLALREPIMAMGASSVVIAGTRAKVKVHAHVDKPGALFALCERFGEVSGQKADDMHRQQHSAHEAQHAVAILTDTAADLPDSELERLGIHVVPLRVNIGEVQYLDKVSISAGELYERMAQSGLPARTSQPPPGDYRRMFEFLGSHFSGVLYVGLSAALSGTWQAAARARSRVEHERIEVLDSKNASAGQGLLTAYAAELAQRHLSFAELCEKVSAAVERCHTFAVMPDMSHAVRGGRVPAWVARVAGWLRVTPVIGNTPEGKIKPAGALLGKQGPLEEKFARWLAARFDGEACRVIVAHAANPEGARGLRDQLVERLPGIESIYITQAGSALGAHAGPGSLIVGVMNV